MSRKILIQVTAPTVLIGLLLFGACLLGANHLSRLQENRGKIVRDHLQSLEAAQELEVQVRQLRYHGLRFLIDGDPRHLDDIDQLHGEFEERRWARRGNGPPRRMNGPASPPSRPATETTRTTSPACGSRVEDQPPGAVRTARQRRLNHRNRPPPTPGPVRVLT